MPNEVKEPHAQPTQEIRPALTPEGQEKRNINLAERLAEEQLRNGTASSQVITHYLKLGTEHERLERAKLEAEIIATQAKARNLDAQTRMEQMYNELKEAMTGYRPDGTYLEEEDDV